MTTKVETRPSPSVLDVVLLVDRAIDLETEGRITSRRRPTVDDGDLIIEFTTDGMLCGRATFSVSEWGRSYCVELTHGLICPDSWTDIYGVRTLLGEHIPGLVWVTPWTGFFKRSPGS